MLRDLDYLAASEINPEVLTEIKKLTIIHGKLDRIAPVAEAKAISENLSQAKFVLIENAGHMPLFNQEFTERIS